MIAGALYIPTRLAELLSLIQHRSKYRHSYRSKDGQQHVIVTGSFEPSSLLEFLREFFCEDHGMDVLLTKVVILCPYEVSNQSLACRTWKMKLTFELLYSLVKN